MIEIKTLGLATSYMTWTFQSFIKKNIFQYKMVVNFADSYELTPLALRLVSQSIALFGENSLYHLVLKYTIIGAR